MDIYERTIRKIGKIVADTEKELETIDGGEIPPYLDCDNENELLDAYGWCCITKEQFEEGRRYFANAGNGIAYKGRDYRLVIKTLKETIATLNGYEHYDRDGRHSEGMKQ